MAIENIFEEEISNDEKFSKLIEYVDKEVLLVLNLNQDKFYVCCEILDLKNVDDELFASIKVGPNHYFYAGNKKIVDYSLSSISKAYSLPSL